MPSLALALLAQSDPTAFFTTWAAFLTALVTIIVGFMFWNAFAIRGEAKDAVKEFKERLDELDKKYNLSKLRLPEEIVKEALAKVREEYEERIADARNRIEVLRLSLERAAPGKDVSGEVREIRERLDHIESSMTAQTNLQEVRPNEAHISRGDAGAAGGTPSAPQGNGAQAQKDSKSANLIVLTEGPKKSGR